MTPAEVSDAVRAHYEAFWPDRAHEEFFCEARPDLLVRRLAPAGPHATWTYATVGAWRVAPSGLEFYLDAPEQDARHVELLALITHFHADPRSRLQIGQTLNLGRPWIDGSQADHLLVSLPYPYGPRLEICHAGDRHIHVLWLLPITSAEAAYARAHGHDALEDKLEAARADWLGRGRASVV